MNKDIVKQALNDLPEENYFLKEKKCTICEKVKLLYDFPMGIKYCKPCYNNYCRELQKKNHGTKKHHGYAHGVDVGYGFFSRKHSRVNKVTR